MDIKKSITYILIFVLGVSFGLLFFRYFLLEKNDNNTYQAGWDEARKKFVEIGGIQGNFNNNEIKSLTGNILTINDDRITVKTIPLDILPDTDLDNRTILINDSTEILKIFKKSELRYQEELNTLKMEGNYMETADTADGKISMFYFEKVNQIDLKIGDHVLIETENDARSLKEFLATKLTISNSSPIVE